MRENMLNLREAAACLIFYCIIAAVPRFYSEETETGKEAGQAGGESSEQADAVSPEQRAAAVAAIHESVRERITELAENGATVKLPVFGRMAEVSVEDAGEEGIEGEYDGELLEVAWDDIDDATLANLLLDLSGGETGGNPLDILYAGVLLRTGGRTDDGARLVAKAFSRAREMGEEGAEVLARLQEIRNSVFGPGFKLELGAGGSGSGGGPALIKKPTTSTFTQYGMGGAGGLFCPQFSPDDPDVLFVACDMSGAYRSLDGGKSWEMLHFKQISGARWNRPSVTGNTVYWARASILKVSNDLGTTWRNTGGNPPWSGNVRYIAALPSNPQVVFVGNDGGVWHSSNGGGGWTTDASEHSGGFVVLKETVYAAVGNQVWSSSDGGGSWVKKPAPARIRNITGGRQGKSSVLFCTTGSGGIIRSRDKGKTWENVGKGVSNAVEISMATGQTSIVWAAQSGRGAWKVWRSEDGGDTWPEVFPRASIDWAWTQTELKWGGYIVEMGFTASPSDPNSALVTTQGDIYLTRDGGKSWKQVQNEKVANGRYKSIGLEVTTCWYFMPDPRDSNVWFIAYTDIGFARSEDRGETWSYGARGCPWANTFYEIAFDPYVPGKMYAACSSRHDIPGWTHVTPNSDVGASAVGGVCVSTDQGRTWSVLGTGLPVLPCTSIAIDPKSPKDNLTMYTTLFEGGVYKSTDNGKTWVKKSNGLGNPGNLHVYKVKIQPETGDLYCLVTANRHGMNFPVPGGLWKSTDGGDSWTDLTADYKIFWPTQFDFHPQDKNTIYVTGSTIPHNSQGGLYVTKDGGKSWNHILTDADMAKWSTPGYDHSFSVKVHPLEPNIIYVSTGMHGLWCSEDGGQTFKPFEQLPFQCILNVTVDKREPNMIYVATYGGGPWKGPYKP